MLVMYNVVALKGIIMVDWMDGLRIKIIVSPTLIGYIARTLLLLRENNPCQFTKYSSFIFVR